VRNAVGLQRVKEQRNIPHIIKRRKANWIGHFLRGNCYIKPIEKEGGDVKTRKKT